MGSGGGISKLTCGAKMIKYFLLFFNFVFFLLGIAITAIGIYILVDPKFTQFKNLAQVDVTQEADKCGIAFIVFGGVMLLISFMGCCGAWKHVRCLLAMYSSILLVLLLAEIALAIFAGVYTGKLKEALSPVLKDTIRDQYMGDMKNRTIASIAWDTIMYNVQCCGVDNYTDFNQTNNRWTYRNNSVIPRACCKFSQFNLDWGSASIPTNYQDPNCYVNPTDANSYYRQGCFDKITQILNQYSAIVIGVAVGFALILLLGVIFGFHLCRRVGELDD